MCQNIPRNTNLILKYSAYISFSMDSFYLITIKMETIVLLLLTLSVTCEAQRTSRNFNKDTSTLSVRELALEEHINFLMGRLNEMDVKQKKVIEDQIAQEKKIKSLEEKNQAQEEKIKDQDNNIEQLTSRLNVTEALLKQVGNDKTSQSQATFYARSLRDGTGSYAYSKGDRLIYETPLINSGGHYNSASGEYTCPTSGVYMFVYSVYGAFIKQGPLYYLLTASLYREGYKMSEVYYTNYNNQNTFLSLSHTDLVSCEAGQRVWVQGDFNRNFISNVLSSRNVFGGVLLYTT